MWRRRKEGSRCGRGGEGDDEAKMYREGENEKLSAWGSKPS